MIDQSFEPVERRTVSFYAPRLQPWRAPGCARGSPPVGPGLPGSASLTARRARVPHGWAHGGAGSVPPR
ncbi:MAG: hypothetical protein EHM14_04395 [Methanothrix sp.]|nr:MAG: hypothetical protein EHM14_04395 [Methanothrix sp.]